MAFLGAFVCVFVCDYIYITGKGFVCTLLITGQLYEQPPVTWGNTEPLDLKPLLYISVITFAAQKQLLTLLLSLKHTTRLS
jgi:hypothetical protein